MTTQEYIQLRAFARVDGTYVGILWIASFACYLGGLSSPMLGLVGGILAVASPFFAAKRLIKFRDDIRDGEISGRRSMLYYALMFFYASLLFALISLFCLPRRRLSHARIHLDAFVARDEAGNAGLWHDCRPIDGGIEGVCQYLTDNDGAEHHDDEHHHRIDILSASVAYHAQSKEIGLQLQVIFYGTT